MLTKIVKIFTVILAAVLLLAVVDWPYIKFNVNFILHPPARPAEQTAAPKPKFLPRGEAKQTDAPDTLTILSLGIRIPVVYVDIKSETVYQKALENGAVHFPGTAMPGQLGNCYIFGHSSDLVWTKGNYKTAFAPLPNIQIGDVIKISDHGGQLFTYRVLQTKVVNTDDTGVLDQNNFQSRRLTLQTSYPLGTALRRFVAVAEMQ